MAEAASINFQQIHSAMHAVNHASRGTPPKYLLPESHSLGTFCIHDDEGEVAKRLEEKMAKASPQAKAAKGYSPLWEGVLNMPNMEEGERKYAYMMRCSDAVSNFCDAYEKATGHKVLRADLHLDEGHINDQGEAVLNPHAHIMADRTDERGRVIKLAPKQLREIQDLAAQATGLTRGKSAQETKRQHISHHAYRSLAEQGRVGGRSELEQLKEDYRQEREKLKASGTASQADYMALKKALEAKTAQLEAVKAAQQQGEKKAYWRGVVVGKTAEKPQSERVEALEKFDNAMQDPANLQKMPEPPPESKTESKPRSRDDGQSL